jgi:hypothetical protein
MAYTADELKRQLEDDEKKQKDSLQAKRDALAADRAAEWAEMVSEQAKAREEILAKIADYEAYLSGKQKLRRKVPWGEYDSTHNERVHFGLEYSYFQAVVGGKDTKTIENNYANIPQSWVSVLRQDKAIFAELVKKAWAAKEKASKQEARGELLFGFACFGVIVIVAVLIIRACVSVVSG